MGLRTGKTVKLDEVLVDRSNRLEGFVNVARKPDGSWVRVPVIIVRGDTDGPTLLVDACTHGDEYEGAEAILKVAASLDPKALKGTLVLVPAVNLDAFSANTRVSPIDDTNLNRVFPGKPQSFITQVLAHTYMERVVKHADYVVSFHGGGVVLHLECIGYMPPENEVGKKSMAMAKAFGGKILWRMQNMPFGGHTADAATKLGIPAILPEIGSHCSRLHDRHTNVDKCATGITNVMKHLGMLEGKVQVTEEQIDQEMHYIHCEAGGIHTPLKQPLEKVKEGEVLAVITDVFGKPVSQVKAPFDGIVIGYWSVPVIKPGDWSYMVGKVLD